MNVFEQGVVLIKQSRKQPDPKPSKYFTRQFTGGVWGCAFGSRSRTLVPGKHICLEALDCCLRVREIAGTEITAVDPDEISHANRERLRKVRERQIITHQQARAAFLVLHYHKEHCQLLPFLDIFVHTVSTTQYYLGISYQIRTRLDPPLTGHTTSFYSESTLFAASAS